MKTLNKAYLFAALLGATLLTACGGSSSGNLASELGGGGNDGGSGQDLGKVQLVLTDAEDDFLTYKVSVDSVTLVSLTGTEVDLLTTTTEVDFVQYQELSELFAVRSIPAGTYESIQLELDYSNSEIVIQDEFGVPATAAPVDSDGAPITQLSVTLQFGDAEAVVISPARVATLTLDLDLAASNEILSFAPAEVLVEPFLMATVEPDADREHRARGLLQSVDTTAENFALNLLPMRLRDGSFGEVTLAVNAETTYDIDGIEYVGTDGLTALDLLAIDSPVVAFAAYDELLENPVASIVQAGTSVAWNNKDIVKGTVTARDENTLTIAGAVVETADGTGFFARDISLTIGDDTNVSGYRLGDSTIANLSVGQNILAMGTYTANPEESASAGTLDATNDSVQMRISMLIARVETTQPLALGLASINRRPISIYDFSGTGGDAFFDADPENYEVSTGILNTSNLETEEWVQVRGYPTPFGAAPEDFDATSIIDRASDSFSAELIAGWEEDATESVILDANAFSLNLDEGRMRLRVGRIPASFSADFELNSVTGAIEDGRYAVQVRGESIMIFRSYTDFLVALTSQLALGDEARKLTARGDYNSIDGVLTASTIIFKF